MNATNSLIFEASVAEMARAFEVSTRAFSKWRRAGLPCIRPGKKGKPSRWDLGAVLAWWKENIAFATAPDGDNGCTRAEAERRRAWAKAKREELALEIEAGEYASVDDMIRMTTRADTAAIALWEQAPDHFVSLLPGKPTAKQKRAFYAAARRHVANVIEAQRQGLIDLLSEYEREAEAEADTPQKPQQQKRK